MTEYTRPTPADIRRAMAKARLERSRAFYTLLDALWAVICHATRPAGSARSSC